MAVVRQMAFTVPHFRKWASELTLDNGKRWEVEQWQADFVADVFAGVPECWLVVPEGNGKTTLIAGLALYYAEHKPEASIPVAASSRDQGRRLYDQAAGFVKRTARLKRVFRAYFGYRAIEHCPEANLKPTCSTTHSRIEIFAADERTGDGAIPDLAITDELHRHKDLGLYRTWRGKLDKKGGQMVAISTAGEPGGEFEQARAEFKVSATLAERRETFARYSRDDAVLHDWAIPEDGDVENLELVKAANPFSGVTVEGLRKKRNSPTMTLEHWSRMVCNLPTRGATAAITEREWAGAVSEQRIPEHQPIWLGLDVAWVDDTTALVPFWARSKTERLLGAATVVRALRDQKLHPDDIKKAILDIHRRNPIAVVVMDTYHAQDVAAWIPGATGARVVARSQHDATASIDFESFMEGLRNGWLRHSDDQSLRTHVMNAVARMLPSGKIRFERPNRTQVKGRRLQPIDALIAAAMVNGEYAVPGDSERKTMKWGAA